MSDLRRWRELVDRLHTEETDLLGIMRLGDGFAAKGAVIYDSREGSPKHYYVPHDAELTAEVAEEIEASANADERLQLLLRYDILREL